jgi:hypothetical protein
MAGCNAHGAVSERFLDTLERVESQGCATALGDNGRARGPYQFWAVAWHDVSAHRKLTGLAIASYATGATNRATARSYVRSYLGMLTLQLTAALGRAPTPAELYAAYNMGFSSLKRSGFNLARCPAATRRNAVRFSSVCNSGGRKPR